MKSSPLVSHPKLTLLVLLPLLSLPACGAKEPDWDFLRTISIDRELDCGATLDAEELVRLAYNGEPFADLLDPEPLPADALQASSSLGSFRHTYPCADTADQARAALTASGYTELSLHSESARTFVFEGRDPVGIEGRYVRFSCAWLSDLDQDLDPPPPWSVLKAGVGGSFAVVPAAGELQAAFEEFAAVSFRTRLMRPVPSLTSYPVRDAVFVGMGESLLTEPFPGVDDPDRTFLPFCSTWVERDVYENCDRVHLGISYHLMLDEAAGVFHQSIPLRQDLLQTSFDFGVEGWCRAD